MANHPYPCTHSPASSPVPAYSWNLAFCGMCGHSWWYMHPANGFDIITKICPDCIPKLAVAQATARARRIA